MARSSKISKRIKCSICGSEELIKSMNLVSDPEIGLDNIFICISCNSSKAEEISISIPDGFNLEENKVELICNASIISAEEIEETDEIKQVLANLGLDKQDDLMYVKFKLVHANENKNKDEFSNEDLVSSAKTPILKLVNWEHGEPSIGTIFDAKFVETEDKSEEDNYIECFCAISKFKYKDQAMEMAKRHEEGTLRFSMETWFKSAKCSTCEEEFSCGEDGYCSHLKNRFTSGSTTSRILKGLTFAGAGVVANPADIKAESLVLAKETESEKENSNKMEEKQTSMAKEILYTQEDLESKIKEAVNVAIQELESQASVKAKELEERISALEGEKTSLASEKESLASKYEQLEKYFNSYKETVASEKKASAWIEELVEIGFEVPNKNSEAEAYNELFVKLCSMEASAFETLKMIAKMYPKENKEKKDKNGKPPFMKEKTKADESLETDDTSVANAGKQKEDDPELPITAGSNSNSDLASIFASVL